MKFFITLGSAFFAISTSASGSQQLIRQDFVRLVPKLPGWIPLPTLWATVSGALLVMCGAALLWGKGVESMR